MLQRLLVDEVALDQFCRRWKITKLELFGSAMVNPATARDLDLLVTFAPEARWGLFDHARIERELSTLLCRKVDLVSRRAVEASRNDLRRSSILSSVAPVYNAR